MPQSFILRTLVILANHSPMNSDAHHIEFDNRRLGNVDQDVIAGAVKRSQPNSRVEQEAVHLVHPSGVPRSTYLRQLLHETKIRRSIFSPPHHAAPAACCGLVLLRRSHSSFSPALSTASGGFPHVTMPVL